MNSILLFGMPGTPEWIIIILMGLLPLIAVIDIMNSTFRAPNAKLIWCAIVVFFPFIGPLLYYWIGREQRVIS